MSEYEIQRDIYQYKRRQVGVDNSNGDGNDKKNSKKKNNRMLLK